MTRLLRNWVIRTLFGVTAAFLAGSAFRYAILTLMTAFEAGPVDVGALAKGGLVALGGLLFSIVAIVTFLRAEAAARKAPA